MFHGIDFLRELTLLSIFVRVMLAVLMGGIVGLERSGKNRPAGLRTHILVCLGSAMVMITSQYISQIYGGIELTRMGAQVVSGIGFLGAGTIIFSSGKIKGLTTAAGLWATACMGLAIGIGFYEGALIAGLTIMATLMLLSGFSHSLQQRSNKIELVIFLENLAKMNEVNKYLFDHNITLRGVDFKEQERIGDYIAVQMSLELPRGIHTKDVTSSLSACGGIYFLSSE